MPEPGDQVVDMPVAIDGQNPGVVTMPGPIDLSAFPTIMESGNLQIAASALGQGAQAASTRRVDRADQLSGDAQSMWLNAFANPTNLMAKALQTMSESGSGATRTERNPPFVTQTPIESTPAGK